MHISSAQKVNKNLPLFCNYSKVNIKLYKFALKTTSMFWDKKEAKKGLPDLPPLKTPMRPGFELPSLNEKEENAAPQGLPSFPDSPLQKGFSQAAIKDAINEENPEGAESEEAETLDMPPQAQKIRTMEMEEWTPDQSSVLEEPPEISVAPRNAARKEEKRTSGEMFVKIEKFNSARRSLDSIKQKLNDIDVLLKKVRDTKMREEQELSGWEKELTAIKARIQDVNDNIFD